jgi:hypothetical protein
VVPFAPESKRSGVERTDFLEAVWYRRTITLPPIWAGKRVLLHFQAVDHDATVWVNGVEVARHRGGFTPFTADLAGVAGPGDQATIVVRARDTRHGAQARGKQATWFANSGPLLHPHHRHLAERLGRAGRCRGWDPVRGRPHRDPLTPRGNPTSTGLHGVRIATF